MMDDGVLCVTMDGISRMPRWSVISLAMNEPLVLLNSQCLERQILQAL